MRIVKKRRLKVLPVPFIFNSERELWEVCVEGLQKIVPVYNRNGLYLNRETRVVWLEVNGEAWIYSDLKYFLYLIETNEFNMVSNELYHALEIVCRFPQFANSKLRHQWLIQRDIRELRRQNRTAMLECQKSLTEFRKGL